MKSEEIKFLIDVGVGKKVEDFLNNEGFNIRAIRDINPRMNDKEVLNLAVLENRILITMDKDFGELVYNSGKHHAGVLILRLEDADGDTKVEVTKKILAEYYDKIESHFCVFQDGRIRIRG